MANMDILKDTPIESIKPYSRNPRKNEKAVKEVMKSIQNVGYRTPVIVDENMEILVGHTRWKAMKELGHKTLNIIQYKDLTKEQKDDYRILDNKTGEVAEWDFDILLEDFDKDHLLDLGFNIKDLPMEEVIEDEAPPVPEMPKTVKGDLYELGSHRLLCGDSTIITDVEKLMDGQKADCVVTDPPYNTGMSGKNDEKARLSHMFKDSFTEEEWGLFLDSVFKNYFTVTKGDCAFYVFIDWRRVSDIKKCLESLMDVKNVIVWDKAIHGLGSDYKFTYELCVVGKKGKPEIQNRFGTDYQDIWRVQRDMGRNKDHATAKPIELLLKPINHASKQDDIVLDLFLGSGSTLIACEQTNRKCYGMELDEKYCDVIVQRYVNFTKNTKIKLNGKEIEWPINSTETV